MKATVMTSVLAAALALGPMAAPTWADDKMGHHKEGGHQTAYGSHGTGHHGGAGHYLRHLLHHQQEIGLTEDQVTKIKTIQLDLDKTRIKAEADIMTAERELKALLDDDKSDLAAVEAKIRQSEGLEASLRMAAIKAKRDAQALLMPEQKEKEKAEHEKMMREHRRNS
jgi:Spy/CpxP family protein refolding chaperone